MIFPRRKIIILFLILNGISFAQNRFSDQFEYANQLFKNKNYFDAITEYKRFLLFISDGTNVFEANYKIGLCYKAGTKFDEAIKYFSVAERSALTTDENFHAKTEIVRCNI